MAVSLSETQSQAVSVIVPVCIQSPVQLDQLHLCLSSINALSPRPEEILLVLDGDDGDNRKAREIAAQFTVRVLALTQKTGQSAARNLAARQAIGEILFFLDADCQAAPDCIEIIQSTFHSHPDVAAIFGSYDDAPGASNFVSQYKNLMNHWTHQSSSEDASTFWSACGAIRREVFLEFGGFDETMWFLEDIDLGYRLRRAGRHIRLVKNLHVKHLKEYSAASLLKSDFCNRALPWTHLLLREQRAGRGLDKNLNLDNSSRFSVLLVYTVMFCALLSHRSHRSHRFSLAARAGLLIAIIALLYLNRRTYSFLNRMRGPAFMARGVFWHWLYFAYGGLGVMVGTLQFYRRLLREENAKSAD